MSELITTTQSHAHLNTRQFVTFDTRGLAFGIDILLVREIYDHLEITPVDDAPPYIKGLLNLRGQIVTVFDLGKRLSLGATVTGEDTSCIVLKTNQELERGPTRDLLHDYTSTEQVGLLVDRVNNVVSVNTKRIEPSHTYSSGVAGRFMDGVIKLQNKLLVTLRTSELLSVDDEFDTTLKA